MFIYSCVAECQGCKHVQDSMDSCSMYARPRAKWGKFGGCEGATHVKRESKEEARVRVGQQKQRRDKK